MLQMTTVDEQQVVLLCAQALHPNTEQVRDAVSKLNDILKNPHSIVVLISILLHSPENHVFLVFYSLVLYSILFYFLILVPILISFTDQTICSYIIKKKDNWKFS